jgi:hypothetical protein
MSRLLRYIKYATFLASALVIGFYVYGMLNEDVAPVPAQPEAAVGPVAAEREGVVAPAAGQVEAAVAPVPAQPEPAVAPVDLARAAPIDEDEEVDYRVAKRLGSLAVWREFLHAHGSGVHAQSAKAEVERLLLAEKAPAPAAAEVSNGASPDVKAVSEATPAAAPQATTEVAALTPDQICKRDGDRLARLRMSPSGEEAVRFANELGCEQLRPQLQVLMESLGYAVPAPTAAEVSNGASPDVKAVSEAARAAPPQATTEVAALTPDEICKRDGDRLARLRTSPSGEEAQRFASELACEKLRPQLVRLMESLGFAPPPVARVNLSPFDISPLAATLTGICASERAALDRLREAPSAEAARLFSRDLKCERLRPQVRLLMESLNLTPEPSDAAARPGEAKSREGAFDAPTQSGTDPDACRREAAELNRIRAAPDLSDAKRFASGVTCDALKPQAARLLESLTE